MAIEKVIQLMLADPSADLNWDTLARTACISRYHFLRIFEGLTGYSPHRFLVALRMDKAKRLLLETSMTISELCFEVGYSSAATFIRVFKMSVGMSPTVFRRMGHSMSLMELKPLLAGSSAGMPSNPNLPSLSISLQAPAMFDGIIFVGLFDAGYPHGAVTAGSVINHAAVAEFSLPLPNKASYLKAVGFAHSASTEIKDYLLAERDSLLTASVNIPSPEEDQLLEEAKFDVSLQYPSIFDPPIPDYLPLLLLELVRRKAGK